MKCACATVESNFAVAFMCVDAFRTVLAQTNGSVAHFFKFPCKWEKAYVTVLSCWSKLFTFTNLSK